MSATTIETFCRSCKEPVDIPVEAGDAEIIAAIGRIGVSLCEKCRPARKQPVATREFVPRIVGNPHNDP